MDPNQPNPTLSPDSLLTAEFEYIAQTAFQANEDRARVTNFYLVTIGSFVAAVLSVQVAAFQVREVYLAFAVLFSVLGLAGVLTLLQLVRLRQAWFESADAMNQIKRFYLAHSGEPALAGALKWTQLPPRYRPWSISFMLALQVALLAGVAFGTTVIFAGLADQAWQWRLAIGIGLAAALLQMIAYRWLLRRAA